MITREQNEQILDALIAADPAWLDVIRSRLDAGETYEKWRESFQTMIDRFPVLQRIAAKRDAEQFFRMMWECSRERASKGRA
jgi:hypothetical protein